MLTRPRLSFASQCAVCKSWPSQAVCQACIKRFSPEHARCELCALELPADLSLGTRGRPARCPSCQLHPAPLDACLAALPYAYPWSDLIGRYKFGNDTGWAAFFAALLLHQPQVQALLQNLEASDWVLPLPLAPDRLASRGFNQAWTLAKSLHRQSHCAGGLDALLLLRIRNTRPQSQLKREDRLANVRGAFAVDPLRTQLLQNRHVVLVDDVMTSGASLFSATQTLRAAGARRVSAVVIARTAPT